MELSGVFLGREETQSVSYIFNHRLSAYFKNYVLEKNLYIAYNKTG